MTKYVASDSDRARQLAPLFGAPVLLELARTGWSARLAAVARETCPAVAAKATFSEFFEYCHHQLWQHHRCEYVYKNAIATKILLGRHSVRTTRFLTEFPVGECKADVVLINGTSTCYEIKTELDGLDRLTRQLSAYSRVFDRTYVVTVGAYADRILAATPAAVGVLVLTGEYSISTYREADSNRLDVDPASMFDCLRREEYLSILRDAVGSIPSVPNTKIYQECRKLFCSLSPAVAHDGMVRALKKRTVSPAVAALVEGGPPSLRAAALGAPLSRALAESLAATLGCGLSSRSA